MARCHAFSCCSSTRTRNASAKSTRALPHRRFPPQALEPGLLGFFSPLAFSGNSAQVRFLQHLRQLFFQRLARHVFPCRLPMGDSSVQRDGEAVVGGRVVVLGNPDPRELLGISEFLHRRHMLSPVLLLTERDIARLALGCDGEGAGIPSARVATLVSLTGELGLEPSVLCLRSYSLYEAQGSRLYRLAQAQSGFPGP